jgi:hypothetical protein
VISAEELPQGQTDAASPEAPAALKGREA